MTTNILITCAKEMVPFLADEVSKLNYSVEDKHKTGLIINGTFEDCMNLNYNLRTAYNVYYELMSFRCDHPDKLYKRIRGFDWSEILFEETYLCITSVADTPTIQNSMFLSLKTKDAIVDSIREKTGVRPNTGPDKDKAVVSIFWKDDQVWVYLNTSGRKLSDRNYRKIPLGAPLQEALAAGILQSFNYDGSKMLLNPMCGSGTLAIEAALIALKKPAGSLKSSFGFQHTKLYDQDKWEAIKENSKESDTKKLPNKILASDISEESIEYAKQNAKTAGVDHLIDFEVKDFNELDIPEGEGDLVMNPPYGIRLGETEDLEPLYKSIGDFLKNKCKGKTGYIFTARNELMKKIRLKPSLKTVFLNGEIDCRLLKFEMYQGTKRIN
ncbi:MAG: RNA methyltransferase [Planctomycetota bacterium]|nr:MAG: RNA methyltransferase [Planctomycetota bacterium]